MAADSVRSLAFDPSVVSQLACPACLAGLRLEEDKLVCAECGHAYPIMGGIPVLIAGRTPTRGSGGTSGPRV
jgi:uncharacterized protein YbaR (Trm112 family)